MKRMLLLGACCSIFGVFPLAALVALVYGFPVPFVGKGRGLKVVIPSQVAVLIYGIMGGFVILGLAGAGAGAVAMRAGGSDARRITRLCVTLSLLVSAVLVILLAILDLIIGPW